MNKELKKFLDYLLEEEYEIYLSEENTPCEDISVIINDGDYLVIKDKLRLWNLIGKDTILDLFGEEWGLILPLGQIIEELGEDYEECKEYLNLKGVYLH